MIWVLTAEVDADSENEAANAFTDLIPFLLVNSDLGNETDGVKITLEQRAERSAAPE